MIWANHLYFTNEMFSQVTVNLAHLPSTPMICFSEAQRLFYRATIQ